MRVKDASLGLNHAHGAIEGLNGEELALAIGHDGGELQANILGVHLSGEAVADALLGIGGDLDAITGSGQVTDCLAFLLLSPQATADEVHGDWVGLIVGDSNNRLGRVTIDELDAKDLRRREGSLSRNSVRLGFFRGLLSILNIRNG